MGLPLLTSLGILLISPLTIFWCSCLMLKGSTVKGKVPVSMANMLTPLHTHIQGKCIQTKTHLNDPKTAPQKITTFSNIHTKLRWNRPDSLLNKHTKTLSLTLTRRPLWVHTSCERAAQGPRRQDFHIGC